MKFQFSNKLILSIGILILVLFIAYFQFLYLPPLKNDLSMKQQTLNTEQKVLDTITRNTAKNIKTITIENTSELQQKVPVKPMQDQLILNLEKAETISNSTIKSMNFSQDSQAESSASQTTTNSQSTNQSSTSNGTTGQNSTNQTVSKQQSPGDIPSYIKKLTVQLTVESPSYEQFETFISTLETLQRIVVVETINYTGNQEVTSLDQTDQPFSYNLTVSAFYMPSLEELQSQLPKINAPAPAGKDNPLAQFPVVMNK